MTRKRETARQRRQRLDQSRANLGKELKRIQREEYDRLVKTDHARALEIIESGSDKVEAMGLRCAHEYAREGQEQEQEPPKSAPTFAPLGASRRRVPGRQGRPPWV
jgi:hypothetical protein